jgi:branched-chain amino acid transport system permease protein
MITVLDASISFREIVQQAINSLGVGSEYALLAIGLAMVFSLLGMVNFAHGELVTVAAYTVYLLTDGGVNFWLAVPAALLAAALAAVAMERLAFRPLRGAGFATLLLASFAVSQIVQGLFLHFVSPRSKSVVVPGIFNHFVKVGGYTISDVYLLSAAAAIVALLGLTAFLQRSRHGVAMLAASQDFEIARVMGVRANAVIAAAFAISGLLAGIAAILILGQQGSVSPEMGFDPVLIAFISCVIGGLGSLRGAVFGGFVYAFIQGALAAFLSGPALSYSTAFALIAVIAILYFRPEGLLVKPAPSL